MAGNDWINSYLEAILDVGPGLDDAKSSLLLRERGRFSPTRYFVEEVITGFDETDLHRSWVKVCLHLFWLCFCICEIIFDGLSLWSLGSGNEESAREEHQIGEYVLEDLELSSPKEAGFC